MASISPTDQAAPLSPEQLSKGSSLSVVRRVISSGSAPVVVIALLVIMTGSGYLFFSEPNATALISVGPSDSSYTALAYARSLVDDQHIGFSPISDSSTTSGMSWVLLLTPIQLIAELTSIPPMLLTKILGLALLFTAGTAVFAIARFTSRTNWLALVAVAPLVLEPRFVYAVVAGTEHALLAAVLGWLLVFRMRHQERRTAFTAAVATGIWPIGAVVFVAYAIDVILRIRWIAQSGETGILISARHLALLRTRLLPPAIVFVLVAAITFFSDNGFLPSTLALQAHPFKFDDWSNLWAIFTEYMSEYSAFDTPLFIASIAIILIGSTAIWRRANATSLVLIPTALVYLYMLAGWRDMNSPAFFQWNLIALIWPMIAIPLGVGMTHILAVGISSNAGRNVAAQLGEPISRIAPAAGAVLLLVGISSSWPNEWRELPPNYHVGALATQGLMIEPAEWLNENGTSDDVVIAVQAGAIRSTLNHGGVYDLTGGGSPHIIRRQMNTVTLEEFEASWIVIWDDSAARSIPVLNFTEGFTEFSGPEYPLDRIAVWRAETNLIDVQPDDIQLVQFDGLPMLGSFDIGDSESEFSAGYSGGGDRSIYESTSSYGAGYQLTESHSTQPAGGFDRFTLPGSPDDPLILAIRYDPVRTGIVSVRANGVDLGTAALTENSSIDSIVAVPIPSNISNSERLEIEVNYDVAYTGLLSILRYWAFTADESQVGRGPDVTIPESTSTLIVSDSFTDLDKLQSGLHFPDASRIVSSWQTDGGRWSIVDGQLQESFGSNLDARILIEAPRAREISTDIVWQNAAVGIVFGYSDPQNWMMFFFFPDINGIHQVRFGVMKNGVFTAPASGIVENATPGDDVNLHVRINPDATITGFFNGIDTATLHLDEDYVDTGFIGVMSHGPGNLFDNFVAHELR